MSPKILVSKTLDEWTVTKITETGTFIKLTSPGVHGKLSKREAIGVAEICGRLYSLPVSVGD